MSFTNEQVAQLLGEINQCCGKSDASKLEKVLSKTRMINLIDSTGNYKVVKCLSADLDDDSSDVDSDDNVPVEDDNVPVEDDNVPEYSVTHSYNLRSRNCRK